MRWLPAGPRRPANQPGRALGRVNVPGLVPGLPGGKSKDQLAELVYVSRALGSSVQILLVACPTRSTTAFNRFRPPMPRRPMDRWRVNITGVTLTIARHPRLVP